LNWMMHPNLNTMFQKDGVVEGLKSKSQHMSMKGGITLSTFT